MQLQVDLGDRSYPIIIESGVLRDSSHVANLIDGKHICIVTNDTIAPLYLKQTRQLLSGAASICESILPDGEAFKNLKTLNQIFDVALEHRLNRKSLLVALGGGVVGDMTGFAAACYQRGIDFIQIPTTLLSQVDSSVGGKTGVNHRLGKNMIGAFHQPRTVLIDTDTLKTLPERELAAGLAEVIKYGLIADVDFFDWLESNINALNAKDSAALAYAIQRSCEIKADVVAQDEREGGIRAILNLGHTFGHAIETHAGYGEWLHGEAVGVGMVMAVDLSVRMGNLHSDVLERAKSLIDRAKLPLTAPSDMLNEDFLSAMSVDKKNVDGKIRLVLMESLGNAYVTDDFEISLMEQVIADYVA
ncbi:3-dehydroquinate synthase [BD1-7 clade bacterium]|uniref:3-dehydroquinate synthase n=1 Tax=BD1-7 clade bacterium TaxID=2029982 RepID=A0A5S9N7C8_9GAMM|nr:3-dehydroquinate synthase [BD1-7 clade bacterium]CAA0085237.1 3-dehydroquinate synthase [BD1-7 clade bacterium]